MALIRIEGMSQDGIMNASTEAKGPGLRPFPCNAKDWIRHTACLLEADLLEVVKTGKTYIKLTVCNEGYGGNILINVDPSDVAPGLTPEKAEKAREGNLKSLLSLIKLLGCHTNGQLDTEKLKRAKNQCMEIMAKHKGFNVEKDGTTYHKVTLVYLGAAADLSPVDTSVQLPDLPTAQGGQAYNAPAAGMGFDDDIGF